MIFGKSILVAAVAAAAALVLSLPSSVSAFTPSSSSSSSSCHRPSHPPLAILGSTVADETSSSSSAAAATTTASSSSYRGEDSERDILVRCARGEITERTPVWLMRQAGRYMAAFREYSDRIPFRERSETPDIAGELSLQCHREYGMDGIIMFSDILTPLPTLGIDFDVVRGLGPVISTGIGNMDDVSKLGNPDDVDFDEKLPFVRELLGKLSKEALDAKTTS